MIRSNEMNIFVRVMEGLESRSGSDDSPKDFIFGGSVHLTAQLSLKDFPFFLYYVSSWTLFEFSVCFLVYFHFDFKTTQDLDFAVHFIFSSFYLVFVFFMIFLI